MQKLVFDNNFQYFVKVIQPKLDKIKIQDPFDNYEFKHLTNYNRKIWELYEIPIDLDESGRTARARAFAKAKEKIYFNKDLTHFVTLTYKQNMQDYNKLLDDVKMFLQSERRNYKNPKYLWVVEKQKRGALHIHMICNDFLTKKRNKNGYYDAIEWPHGWTSIKTIKGTDVNFRPYLYLFKYMKKSHKIGGRYVHTSRNLKNFDTLKDSEFDKTKHKRVFKEINTSRNSKNFDTLKDFEFDKTKHKRVFREISEMGSIDRHIIREYYERTN